MNIHLFYRHYNIEGNDNKGRPQWFDFEKCFKNLLSSIKNKPVILYVIMDGNVDNNFINKYKTKFTLHTIKAGNDTLSALKTYNIISTLKNDIGENDLIALTENDYLHDINWVEKTIELFSTYSNLNYVSLYDHNDKYFLPLYDDLTSKIITTPTHHWRTTPSTCGTYIVPKKIMFEDLNDHINVVGDHNKWLHLNDIKSRFVLTPIPGLSTHCMDGLLSPTIKWETI